MKKLCPAIIRRCACNVFISVLPAASAQCWPVHRGRHPCGGSATALPTTISRRFPRPVTLDTGYWGLEQFGLLLGPGTWIEPRALACSDARILGL